MAEIGSGNDTRMAIRRFGAIWPRIIRARINDFITADNEALEEDELDAQLLKH